MSASAKRIEDALAYLHRIVTGEETPDAVRVAAARALVARDSREAGADQPGGTAAFRVLIPRGQDADDDE